MTEMVVTEINGRWRLLLPEHRAVRPEWKTGWEVERIDAMYATVTSLVRMAEALHPGWPQYPLVVDVGAEEGDMSALWALWGADVILAEPNPKVWPNIRAIFEANELTDRVMDWWVGFLSDRVQRATIRDEERLRWRRRGEVWPECAFGPIISDHGFRHLAEEADITPQITLDDLCLHRRHVDVITMDVEGAELHVLKGATGVLDTYRPFVFVSIHPPALRDFFGETEDDVHDFMSSKRYVPRFLAEDHERHFQYTPEEYA